MKKKAAGALSLVLSVMLVTAGCGNGNDKVNESKSNNNEKKEVEAVSGASEASYTPFDQLKDKYDIIIVGAGGAGMSAALDTKEKGMNPVILEKMPVAGGNTTKSSSGMNASETKFQKEQNIEDSNDLFYEESLKGTMTLTTKKCFVSSLIIPRVRSIGWIPSESA